MLYQLKDFEQFALSLPAATLHDQWESRIAKVGGKMFMALGLGGLWHEKLVFKTTEMSFIILIEQQGIIRAPYASRGNWVAVSKEAGFSDDELKLYLEQSYKLICGKLTKKMRNELGINVI